MKVVQIKEFLIDTSKQEAKANEFLANIPAEDVIDIKYQTHAEHDEYEGNDWHSTILIVYKTEKDR